MALIDVKYTRGENLTPKERKELKINGVTRGLVAIEITNPTLKRVGIPIKNDDYVSHLLSLGR